jgi:hypothetical protein
MHAVYVWRILQGGVCPHENSPLVDTVFVRPYLSGSCGSIHTPSPTPRKVHMVSSGAI